MRRYALLAAVITLLESGSLGAAPGPQEAWPARGDGADPNDIAAEYTLTAAGAEGDKGTILFEYYWGASGSVTLLVNLPTFPDYPDDRQWRASFEGPTDWTDNYGTYVRGYLYPPETGNYTFWIASDDQSELWLSTDESPDHGVRIASVAGCTPARDFDNTGGLGGPQQKSAPIPLTAGKKYYIEALQAEGIGGDNLAVAWQGPGIPQRVIIAGKYLSPLIGPQEATETDLLGWWKLDEGSGDLAADSSGEGNDGILHNPGGGLGPNGSAWVVDAQRDMVLSFNGDDASGAYVDAGRIVPALTLTNDLAWAFWAKQDAGQSTAVPGGGTDVILGNRYGGTQTPLQFVKFTPTKFEYYNDDTSYNMAIDYVDVPGGQWVHHAAVKKGAILTYYRNGIDAGTCTLTKTMDKNPFFMGGDAAGERWRGSLSDVRLYDRALLSGEIRWLTGMFQGEYFANVTLSGGAALTRLDRQISFNWGAGDVFPGTWDQCSVRWTGEIEPAFREAYTFYVNTDDGARLWLNDDLIIDAWWDQGITEHASQPIQLVAGQRYQIRLEWYENTGGAVCELRWSSPSTPKQVISSGRQQGPGTSPGGSPSITLDPPSGPVGTSVTITGSGFAANTSGNVTFVSTSNSVTTTPTGTFSTTMTVPSGLQADHSYPVQADIPSGGSIEASSSFTVTTSGPTPSVVVSPTSGPVGTEITITGSGFAANTSGRVYLYLGTEPVAFASVTTSPTGTFSVTMAMPYGWVEGVSYPVRADIPMDGSIEASASFAVTARTPSIVVSPISGPVGTEITITGSGFAANTSGRVYLYLGTEPVAFASVTTSPTGTFSVTMAMPYGWVEGVSYPVRADIPMDGSIEASASFTVTTSSPTPTIELGQTSGSAGTVIGIAGAGFAGNTSGTVTLAGASVSVTTKPAGWFTTTLTVPSVSPGDYLVQADIPSGGPVEDSITFTVTTGALPVIELDPTSGPVGTAITITGSGFAANTSGNVAFAGTSKSVTTSPTGTFSTTMTVPSVSAGSYPVQADIPSGGSVEASASFTVTTSGPTPPILILIPTAGRVGTVITIGGMYFAKNTSGTVTLGTASVTVTTEEHGIFETSLTVPSMSRGIHHVQADIPSGGSIEASASFAVK